MAHKLRGAVALIILAAAAACTPWQIAELPLDPATPVPPLPTLPTPTLPTPALPTPVVFVGAGDIARCNSRGAEATARLLDTIPGTVFTLGDNAYENGTARDFQQCYEPTWGRHKARTRPVPGNHEYHTTAAQPYFQYFGAAAGAPGQGYYSYDLGAWHIVALNSNCGEGGGCEAGSIQEQWLRADLAAHPAGCTLAYWHHARFSVGRYDDNPRLRPFWQALYEAGADLVLAGHDHNYQRWAPQDPDGQPDPQRGLRQFVVGTGGAGRYAIQDRPPLLAAANADTYGVFQLTLRPDGYDWVFVPVDGATFTDAGTAACH